MFVDGRVEIRTETQIGHKRNYPAGAPCSSGLLLNPRLSPKYLIHRGRA